MNPSLSLQSIKPHNKTQKKIINPKSIKTSKFNNTFSNVVYIGHLPKSLTQTQFQQFFQIFGQIKNLKLSKNQKTGKSKHYGFIEFKYYYSILILKKLLRKIKLLGKQLVVRSYRKSEIHEKMFWGNKRIIESGRNLINYSRRFNSTKLMEELVNSRKMIEDQTIRRRIDKRAKRIEKKEEKAQTKLTSAGIYYEIPKKRKGNINN